MVGCRATGAQSCQFVLPECLDLAHNAIPEAIRRGGVPGTSHAERLPVPSKENIMHAGPDSAPPPALPPVLRIAIADDDPDSLELLRLAIDSPLAEIHEATNGVELVQLLLQRKPFDLVVTDVLMPWAEGLDVLRSARKNDVLTPVLVISGLTGADLQSKVDRLGNARLLHKPFGILDLQTAISALLKHVPSPS
jgi:CheY-like chemotaxis protein